MGKFFARILIWSFSRLSLFFGLGTGIGLCNFGYVNSRVLVGWNWFWLNDADRLRGLLGKTFEKLIWIQLTLFDLLKFLQHISFLFFDFLFHLLSLFEELLTFDLDVLCSHHFFFNLTHQLLFFVFLHFHDSFYILLLVGSLDDLFVMFLHHLCLSFLLHSSQVLFLWLQFLQQVLFVFFHLFLIVFTHLPSFIIFAILSTFFLNGL